jgi:hypothetical protein
LLNPFAGADGNVSQLNRGIAFVVFLRPPREKRGRHAGSGAHQNNRILRFSNRAVHSENENGDQAETKAEVTVQNPWLRNSCPLHRSLRDRCTAKQPENLCTVNLGSTTKLTIEVTTVKLLSFRGRRQEFAEHSVPPNCRC